MTNYHFVDTATPQNKPREHTHTHTQAGIKLLFFHCVCVKQPAIPNLHSQTTSGRIVHQFLI